MKKILHITNHLYGAAGAERQLMLNVEALDKSRFENYICCVEKPRDLAIEASRLGIPVFSLGAAGRPQWPKAILRLRNLVHNLRIDLIHTSLFESDIIGGITGRLCGVPVVSTLCSVGGEPERLVDNPHMNRFKLALTTKLWGLALRSCHYGCIANSNTVRASAIRTYGLHAKRLTVIHRALVGAWFGDGLVERVEHLRQGLNLDGTHPILLNVGRPAPEKGQRYLIQAMPKVLARFPQAKLLIAGEGPLREPLTSLSRELGLDGHVSFLGRRDDIKELLEVSDIFAFPSLFEGCPNALMEAMAVAKPCVASRIGANEEVIEDGVTGLLVPSQSSEALAEGIIRLALNQEEASLLGQRAREMARERFTVALAVRKLEAVYDRVIQDYYGPRRENRASPSSPVQAGK